MCVVDFVELVEAVKVAVFVEVVDLVQVVKAFVSVDVINVWKCMMLLKLWKLSS